MSMQCVNCAADVAGVLDALRPGDDHRVAGAAEVRGDLLAPLERRVAGPRPGGGVVRREGVGAPGVEAAVLLDQRELLLRRQRDAVLHRHLVERAGDRAFHAGAVVAEDVDDQRVVELAQLVDRVEQAADVPVGVLLEAGVDLHLACVELLLVVAGASPRPGSASGRGVSSASAGITPSCFCRANVSSRSLSQPWSNLPRYFSLHSVGDLVRRVGAAGGVVHEPRLVRVLGAHLVQPLDRLVGQVVRQVVARRPCPPGRRGSCCPG